MKRHNDTVHEKNSGKVECKYCLNSYVNILVHLKKKTNCMKNYVKNNEYDTLKKNWKKKSELRRKKSELRINLKCNECGKQFANESTLKRHNDTVHEKNKDFICNICEKKFTQKHNLLSHQKKQHNTEV